MQNAERREEMGIRRLRSAFRVQHSSFGATPMIIPTPPQQYPRHHAKSRRAKPTPPPPPAPPTMTEALVTEDHLKLKAGNVIIAQDESKQPLGYCIGHDQYFKRDDVGIIYQLNVLPGKQRSLIGAALIKAMFDRAAYGCRLFCCWCAQDIEANHFW